MGESAAGESATMSEDVSAMLSSLQKECEKLRQKLATEVEARKRLEGEKRDIMRQKNISVASSQVEGRQTGKLAEALARKKDEVTEMRKMMQHQTIEIANLQNSKAALERRILEHERHIGQYDDSFYALEARNVRDRTRMEEMGKAKTKAEEERSVYRLMLEQVGCRMQDAGCRM